MTLNEIAFHVLNVISGGSLITDLEKTIAWTP